MFSSGEKFAFKLLTRSGSPKTYLRSVKQVSCVMSDCPSVKVANIVATKSPATPDLGPGVVPCDGREEVATVVEVLV